MPTIQEKAICISTLAGEAAAFEATVLSRDAKARALDDVMGSGLSEDDRAELHKLMDFTVKKKGRFGGKVKSMDKEGQRHSVETEDVKEYKSLSDQDWKNINQAMQKILKLKEDLLNRKGPDGAPLFDEGDLADELFTPLVREGLMPETFVLDEHSQTAKLLKETFAAYKKMLEDAKKKKEEKAAKQESDASGAGDWKDKAKAYWHTVITVIGAILVLLNQITPITSQFGGNVQMVTNTVIVFLTALVNFLKSNEIWVDAL